MNEQDNTLWVDKQPFPFISPTQFMIHHGRSGLSDKIYAMPENVLFIDEEQYETADGIYVYNCDFNYWEKIDDFSLNCIKLKSHSTTYDPKNRMVWIITLNKKLCRYGINTGIWETLLDDFSFDDISFSHMNIVAGSLHIINKKTHFIFDENTGLMKKMHYFDKLRTSTDWIGIHGNGLLYVKHLNSLFLFERRLGDIIIHEYELTTDKWKESIMKANSNTIKEILYAIYFNPNTDQIATSVVATVNGDYIFFLNGQNGTLYMLNTMTKQIIKYMKDGPEFGANIACYLQISRKTYDDEMSVFGWVRENTSDCIDVPFAIVNLISGLVCNEILHVFEFMECSHWTISVDDVITSIM